MSKKSLLDVDQLMVRLEPIFKREERRVRRYARRNHEEFARDAAQDARLKLWKTLRNGYVSTNPEGLAVRTVHNAACEQSIRERRHDECFVASVDDADGSAAALEPVSPGPSPEEHILIREGTRWVRRLVGRLSPRDARIVWRVYVDEWPRPLVAAVEGTTAENIDQVLCRARRRMQKWLAPDPAPPRRGETDRV